MSKLVLFQGDSLTDCRRNRDDGDNLGKGYPAIVRYLLRGRPDLRFLNRGVGGDRVCHLRSRWQSDCLDLKPDILAVTVGVNEVVVKLFEGFYTPLDEYERDYRLILEQVKTRLPQCKIILVEPYIQPIDETMRELCARLEPVIEVTKRVFRDYGDEYIPLGELFAGMGRMGFPPADVAEDGIHPTPLGYYLLGTEMARAIEKLI